MSRMSDDQAVAELVTRIQVHVFPRRIRMREFFGDFDALRCGRCTRVQFGRALGQLGMHITDEEVALMAEHFVEAGPKVEKPQVVNYVRFCELIEEVYEQGSPDPPMTSSPTSSTMSFYPSSMEDEETVMQVLHKLATLCKARGVDLKAFYQPFSNTHAPHPSRPNPRHGGKVTVPQFVRNFPFPKEFGANEMHVLIERYKTKDGDVHFQAMHNDVSEVTCPDPPPFPTSPLSLRADSTEWSHHTLSPVAKIQAKVVERRIRMYEHFQDFDPLRKGHCTVGQVKTVFTILNLAKEINKADFDKLVFGYMRDDGLFCYTDFCADVDKAFTTPGLEKDPLATISLPDSGTTSPARRNTIRLGSSRKRQIAELEEKLRTRVRLRNILIKPQFQDMDRTSRGFITRSQFGRVMGMLGFELSEIEVGLLCSTYCNFGNHLDFNYVDFCKSVDPPDPDAELAMEQLTSPHAGSPPSKYFDDLGKVQPLDRAVCTF